MATGSIKEWTCKDGTVHYQITVEGERNTLTGKRNRVYKTVKGSLKEAKSVMHKLITDVENDKYVKPSNKLVGDWVTEWIDTYLPNVEETTRVGYKTKLRCYIKPYLGNIMIKSLRAEHVQRMINDMIARGLSPKNIRDTFNNINAAMKKAVVLRMIPYNPCEGVVLPKRKKYKAKVYDLEMIHKLLDIATGTDMYIPILLCVSRPQKRGNACSQMGTHRL